MGMDEDILDFVPVNVKGCFLGGKITQFNSLCCCGAGLKVLPFLSLTRI